MNWKEDKSISKIPAVIADNPCEAKIPTANPIPNEKIPISKVSIIKIREIFPLSMPNSM